MLRLTPDRAVPMAIALIVVLAAGVSLAPGAASTSAAEGGAGVDGEQFPAVRLAIGGDAGPVEFDGPITVDDPAAAGVPVDDGTIYKPVAVDTSVKSSTGMLQHHTVQEGDTLASIATRYGVSTMTVWWANKLEGKAALKAGRDLVIPPVNGLVVTVQAGDTLESLAARNKIEAADILSVNELDDPNLIVGQVLLLPGAEGAPMPTDTPKPVQKPPSGGGGGGTVAYSGGSWAWPVAGGGNYISQYFRYGHLGVDIAADYGTTIVAPLAGRVVFGGWKSNGGGYQVWISHGNGLYTAQNHMDSVSVSTGQDVSRGQRVGRVGMSGWASGSHDHFEVWVGMPWESGSYRVNPLRYY
jgi:murein DD-endopeptidase MepM/ murein hydrolase activator NlpD